MLHGWQWVGARETAQGFTGLRQPTEHRLTVRTAKANKLFTFSGVKELSKRKCLPFSGHEQRPSITLKLPQLVNPWEAFL